MRKTLGGVWPARVHKHLQLKQIFRRGEYLETLRININLRVSYGFRVWWAKLCELYIKVSLSAARKNRQHLNQAIGGRSFVLVENHTGF